MCYYLAICVIYVLIMHVSQTDRTPLHEAACNGHTGAVEILAFFRATVDIIDKVS